jgi:hypothetical protein
MTHCCGSKSYHRRRELKGFLVVKFKPFRILGCDRTRHREENGAEYVNDNWMFIWFGFVIVVALSMLSNCWTDDKCKTYFLDVNIIEFKQEIIDQEAIGNIVSKNTIRLDVARSRIPRIASSEANARVRLHQWYRPA